MHFKIIQLSSDVAAVPVGPVNGNPIGEITLFSNFHLKQKSTQLSTASSSRKYCEISFARNI